MDALEGITALDFTSHLAGPYCTKLLSDMGARVIKVERPGGDPARRALPFLDDRPGPDRSATWHYLNTNKESVVVDLKKPGSREVVRRLVASAQIAVTSSSPLVERELGIDYPALSTLADIPVVPSPTLVTTDPTATTGSRTRCSMRWAPRCTAMVSRTANR